MFGNFLTGLTILTIKFATFRIWPTFGKPCLNFSQLWAVHFTIIMLGEVGFLLVGFLAPSLGRKIAAAKVPRLANLLRPAGARIWS